MAVLTKKERIAKHKKEAVEHVRKFYEASWQWRSQAYHAKWDQWERNYRNIYDPGISAKKEPWQARMFVPATVTNVEVIDSALTKILLSHEHPMGFKARETGDELQAELNTNLIDHQLDVSEFVLKFGDCSKEMLIFGSSFMKIFWEKKRELRHFKSPVYSGLKDFLTKGIYPGTIVGQKDETKNILVRDQTTVKKVHIRNIFLEPNSLDMQRVLERDKITYAEILETAKQGFFDMESVIDLEDFTESSDFETEIKPVKYDQNIHDPPIPRPGHEKLHTVFEYWGQIPRKWIETDLDDDQEESEEIIPGKITIASGHFFLCSEENQFQSMQPPYLKLSYIDSGQTYGIGVAQIMEGLQEEYNEIRNLRIDNVNFIMNKIFIGIKSKLVNPDNIVSKPGCIIFAKGSDVTDVRNVISELPISDVALSAFRETGELERQIQEVTGANRVTTGTAGLVRDANQTLGGMELLNQAAANRFTLYAFRIGRSFIVPAAKKIMELIYMNMNDEMIKRILGIRPVEYLPGQIAPKWTLFKKTSPQELFMDYDIVPYDVFSEENKGAKAQMLLGFGQFLASVLPQWNPGPLVKKVGHLQGLSSDEVSDIVGDLNQNLQTPMSMGQGIPSISKVQSGPVSSTPSINAAPAAVPTGAGLGPG